MFINLEQKGLLASHSIFGVCDQTKDAAETFFISRHNLAQWKCRAKLGYRLVQMSLKAFRSGVVRLVAFKGKEHRVDADDSIRKKDR
ncbi:hypothetical protein [Sinorhizobium meliloti]|uniref:hypothetical protein n=1 Tax=Rhizobium meliloti TaxID=382 RepID=UPI0020919F85|nr:hypothetical protein [Sinorhizobium meliloti]MCO5966044.1 hypothetical protein [Sinorhizobium meliloti]